jgi:integrase
VDYESHAVALDRNELGALLVAAGLGPPTEHALISLLALNGLRVSEATGADIEHLGLERGHRTLTITRKGGKRAVVPLAPRTARAIDLGRRRTLRRTDLPHDHREPTRPARRRKNRPASRPPSPAHQADRPAHAQARIHHRRRNAAIWRMTESLSRRSPGGQVRGERRRW